MSILPIKSRMVDLVAKASPDDRNTSTAEWSTYTSTVTCCCAVSMCIGPPMRLMSDPASNVMFSLSSLCGNTTCRQHGSVSVFMLTTCVRHGQVLALCLANAILAVRKKSQDTQIPYSISVHRVEQHLYCSGHCSAAHICMQALSLPLQLLCAASRSLQLLYFRAPRRSYRPSPAGAVNNHSPPSDPHIEKEGPKITGEIDRATACRLA